MCFQRSNCTHRRSLSHPSLILNVWWTISFLGLAESVTLKRRRGEPTRFHCAGTNSPHISHFPAAAAAAFVDAYRGRGPENPVR